MFSTEKPSVSNYVPFETIQFVPATFSNITKNKRDVLGDKVMWAIVRWNPYIKSFRYFGESVLLYLLSTIYLTYKVTCKVTTYFIWYFKYFRHCTWTIQCVLIDPKDILYYIITYYVITRYFHKFIKTSKGIESKQKAFLATYYHIISALKFPINA